MFKHFVITRFNLRTTYWDKTKNNESVLTDEWQQHRLQVFRRYCFPSIVNQSNQNFIWLVYFDTQSPGFIMKDIEKMKSEYRNFQPVFLPEMELIKEGMKTDMKNHFERDTEFVISSRLDSDDALHCDFVNEIQKRFAKQVTCIVDPEVGLCLQTEPHLLISKYKTAYSPFVSLIEKTENFKTVFSRIHNQWKDVCEVEKIQDKILWLQLIHGKNLLNNISADKFIYDKKILTGFGINVSAMNSGFLYFLKVNFLNVRLKMKKILRAFAG